MIDDAEIQRRLTQAKKNLQRLKKIIPIIYGVISGIGIYFIMTVPTEHLFYTFLGLVIALTAYHEINQHILRRISRSIGIK